MDKFEKYHFTVKFRMDLVTTWDQIQYSPHCCVKRAHGNSIKDSKPVLSNSNENSNVFNSINVNCLEIKMKS